MTCEASRRSWRAGSSRHSASVKMLFRSQYRRSEPDARWNHPASESRRGIAAFAGFGAHHSGRDRRRVCFAARSADELAGHGCEHARTSARGRCWSAKGSATRCCPRPIILYDYPQIAPESPGDLFDGTEIDEILTLRIMTLTDEEKREMRQSRRARPPDSGANRDVAGGAVHETARRAARTAARQGGDAMNEWEWQLLEDKTPVET